MDPLHSSESLRTVTNICIILSFIAFMLAVFTVLFRMVRPYFPVKVNCWFCNRDSKVPYGNKTCWDCPHCEQYNGFAEDGDYNKSIPAQHKETLNHPASIENRQKGSFSVKAPTLCEMCNRNQLLKIRQLANFVPYNEANFDMEVEGYKYHLEQIYRLCQMCQLKVNQVLKDQDDKLHESFNNSAPFPKELDSSYSLNDSNVSSCSTHLMCQLSAPLHVKLLRWSSFLCAIGVFFTSLINLLLHSDSMVQPIQWLPRLVIIYSSALHKGINLMIVLGLVTGLIAIYRFGKHSLHICDAISSTSWLLCLAIHSKTTEKHLKSEDLFLLQGICSTFNMAVCLWGTFCPRYEKGVRGKSKGRKRNLLNLSSSSSVNSSGSQVYENQSPRNSPPPLPPQASTSQQHRMTEPTNSQSQSVADSPVAPIDDRFETMSLGTPSRSGTNSLGVFRAFNNQQPGSSNVSPSKQQSDTTLRQRKKLISPARFKPTFKTDQRLLNTAAPTQNNINSGSQDNTEDNGSSQSSYCPVGTTSGNDDVDDTGCTVIENKKRSIWTRIGLGVSIGLNMALVFYFLIDFNNISETVNSVKDSLYQYYDNFTTNMSNKSWDEALIAFIKAACDQGSKLIIRLTQEIPGETEVENSDNAIMSDVQNSTIGEV